MQESSQGVWELSVLPRPSVFMYIISIGRPSVGINSVGAWWVIRYVLAEVVQLLLQQEIAQSKSCWMTVLSNLSLQMTRYESILGLATLEYRRCEGGIQFTGERFTDGWQ